MRKPKLINKQHKKRIEGKCHFCGEDNYSLLDCHRILPGEKGGKYTKNNTLVVCANCHRKLHSGIMEILGRYNSTGGVDVIHYIEEGEEKWI